MIGASWSHCYSNFNVRLWVVGMSATIWTVMSAPDDDEDDDDECAAVRRISGKRKRNTWRKPEPSATLSTTNPTWLDLGSNLGCRSGEKPVTHRLNYDRTLIYSNYKTRLNLSIALFSFNDVALISYMLQAGNFVGRSDSRSFLRHLNGGTAENNWKKKKCTYSATPDMILTSNILNSEQECFQTWLSWYSKIFCNPNLFAICASTFKLYKNVYKWHVEECSVALLCNW
jgi:hypothetical protein